MNCFRAGLPGWHKPITVLPKNCAAILACKGAGCPTARATSSKFVWADCARLLEEKRTEIAAMTLPNLNTRSLNYLATHDFQTCKTLPRAKRPDLVLRHWRFAWSTNCESCGRSLVSPYPQGGISKRMKARAARGAKRLASAVIFGDQKTQQQFRQTLDLLQLWGLADAGALISENQAHRTIALAAIELGSRRSFQRFAFRVGRNSRVAQSLLRAFPRQREALETIQKWARLSENRYLEREVIVRRATDECRNTTKTVPSKRALTAARSAVQELGSDADRLALPAPRARNLAGRND